MATNVNPQAPGYLMAPSIDRIPDSRTQNPEKLKTLIEDAATLRAFLDDPAHRQILEKSGTLTETMDLASMADAKLDSELLFPPDPWNPQGRLQATEAYLTRAWLRVNAARQGIPWDNPTASQGGVQEKGPIPSLIANKGGAS